jgi:serine protease Do
MLSQASFKLVSRNASYISEFPEKNACMIDPVKTIFVRAARVAALGVQACVFVLAPNVMRADESLRMTPIVKAIRNAEPAVVNIQGNKVIPSASDSNSSSKQTVNGMGSGVIIDSDGLIVTNLHVVQDVSRIEVTLADGTPMIARLINYDPKTDLALIKVEPSKPLPVVKFGKSSDLLRGETVIAIGNPFGYQHTVTVGIISALHRDIPVNGAQDYEDLIQTNADINPGNSGGPLVNIDGEVIGINVAVRVGAQGIGFAIPIDIALEVAANLVEASRSEPTKNALKLRDIRSPDNSTVEVSQATSVFLESGIEIGDRIVAVDGTDIRSRLDFELAMLRRKPGDETSLTVLRQGQTITRRIPTGTTAKPERLASSKTETTKSKTEAAEKAWENFGIRLVDTGIPAFTTMDGSYRGGLKISEVRAGSPAAAQKIQTGDILVGVGNYQTPTFEDLDWVWNKSDILSQPQIRLTVTRGMKTYFRAVAPSRTTLR